MVELIRQYNPCQLTHESDRLIAIAGVARHLEPIMSCRYLVGLWEHCLVEQLAWIGLDPYSHMHKAPSWSWACRPGKLMLSLEADELDALDKNPVEMVAKDVSLRTIDGNEMSQALSGCLQLTARLVLVTAIALSSAPNLTMRYCRLRFYTDVLNDQLDGRLLVTISYRRWSRPENGTEARGLVLRQTGQNGQHYRVGSFTTDHGFATDDGFSGHVGGGARLPSVEEVFFSRADAVEKAQITEDLYEEYHEDMDKYTFTII
jgi:hypothetical protein